MDIQELATMLNRTISLIGEYETRLTDADTQIAELNAQVGTLAAHAQNLEDEQNSPWWRTADRVIAGAKALGKFNIPYDFGGDTFSDGGLDCSGLTKLVFDLFAGTKLPRVSGDQAQTGTAVEQKDARKGDLLFFTYSDRNDGDPTHVGIYMGANQMIHTNNNKERIHVSVVKWDTITAIRRVIV